MHDNIDIYSILKEFGINEIKSIACGGGTASPKYIVETPSMRYILKQRREEFCPEEIILFDHSVLTYLHRSGFPVSIPEATIKNKTFCFYEGKVYELFKFIEGLEDFTDEDKEEIMDAGRTLGFMHNALKNFSPNGKKEWKRELHPSLIKDELIGYIKKLPSFSPDRNPVVKKVLKETDILIQNFHTETLTHSITHGDYTTANVKFKEKKVAGIFDFDWTSFQNTLYDISRGIIYFCFKRKHPVDGGNIWSLVQPCEIDISAVKVFIDAYKKEFLFTEKDAVNLFYALKETIIGVRVRAIRKVPDIEKQKMLDVSLLNMLDSIDRHRKDFIIQ
ncbi:MAG: phosphotransferase [Candidatus Ratteibacteria bacterium]|nr:phosphotransferase [Candidatus Ratteibacteria bacterium]